MYQLSSSPVPAVDPAFVKLKELPLTGPRLLSVINSHVMVGTSYLIPNVLKLKILFTIAAIVPAGQSLAKTGTIDTTIAPVGTAILKVAVPEPGVLYSITLAHSSC